MKIHAKTALLNDEWRDDLRLHCVDGVISGLEAGVAPGPEDTRVDCLLPALCNLHSHSFQRAMAGMTEFRSAEQDSFWTWRALMYRFLDRLDPEQIEAIAAMVFMEMQEAGYAAVGEFHYLHHQPGGEHYERVSELSERIFAAASQTGIGLTHLPVLYSYGGVDQRPLEGGQLRFGNDVDGYLRLIEECGAGLSSLPSDARMGVAPHSLRATSGTDLSRLLASGQSGPIHLHISEQIQEVNDVEAALGKRPVDWLLQNFDVDENWCLIHATHMQPHETRALAQSGAVAGLCPITEANLGDGAFDGPGFLAAGGRFGIGSDSNIRIALGEELRTLEYSQRLRDRQRNVLQAGEASVGATLYLGAEHGGAQALARDAGEIAKGKLADLVALDLQHPSLFALSRDQILDGLCFVAPGEVVTDCWSAGRHMVRQGLHVEREAIVGRFKAAISRLIDGL